jgi:hypothetical protein
MVDLNKDHKYEEYINSPLLQSVFPEPLWNYMNICGEKTGEVRGDMWKKNTDKNYERLFKKCGAVGEQLGGFAKNKAAIIVGAGPSFNKNKDLLKKVYDFNIQFPIDEQPFVIIASNHQLKPLLDMGIFPHITVILDGGNHFRDQFINLNTDMKCVVVANIATDPKLLKRLDRDGHTILFFVSDSNKSRDLYKEKTGKDPENVCTFSGGNVMNTAFMISMRFLHSRVIMTLGNDLSFPLLEDADKRRDAFYADGDYSTQDNKDEAKNKIAWMAYEHAGESAFDAKAHLVNYTKVLTSHQLLIYKAWVEMHIAKWAESEDFAFRYYNCSEGGILGVLAKHSAVEDLENEKNWMLMDDIAPNRWFTKPLEEAVKDFLEIRQSCQTQTGINGNAGGVIDLLPGMGGASGIVLPGQSQIL